jgi:hypothetical protein
VNAVLLKGVEDDLDEPRSDELSAAPEPEPREPNPAQG